MRGILFSPLLLLTGCATTSAIHTQIVEKPVVLTQSCVLEKDIPIRPEKLSKGPAPNDLESALSLALSKISEWSRYGDKAGEILANCK